MTVTGYKRKLAREAKAAIIFRAAYDSLSDRQKNRILILAFAKKEETAKKEILAKKKTGKADAEVEHEEEEVINLKPMTERRRLEIIDEVKAARKLVSLVVPIDAYVRILPSLQISRMNSQELCTWGIDKITRGTAITELSGALPLWADLLATYDLLFPLASVGRGFLSPPDRTKRTKLTKKLKAQFQDNANSCAGISNGNLELYQLTGYGAQGVPVKHTGTLPMCNAKTDNKKGEGNMGVSCDVVPFAIRYIVYYGITPDYATSWNFSIGTSRQLIENLTPGVAYYFIMVAVGPDGEGLWMTPIKRNAPYA